MKKIINSIIIFIVKTAIKIHKKINRESFNARIWSNNELKKTAHFFSGKVINVSGGNDNDKQNNVYKNYFVNKSSYSISNYNKTGLKNEIILDLEKKIQDKLVKVFDVVFSHTVLEHVYDIDTAIKNLCKLSDDVIITVVPFLQTYHHEEKFYFDYWRFSPLSLIKKFGQHGFKTVYINWNNDAFGNLYIFHIASCKPEKYKKVSAINKDIVNQYAPGYYRQNIFSFSKRNSGRITIKMLDRIINTDKQ